MILIIVLLVKNHIDADCSPLSEETKYKKFFTKVTLKIAQEKYLLFILWWKLMIGYRILKI